ncbi:hypothetical protein ACFWPQ_01500 [Streptomyces sp. NPDC058464]|uniref:hypothetical protein n=1 Tax=Streptomyces sp. NPDC058464 TaxID=3346511 RepID=UPI0036619908
MSPTPPDRAPLRSADVVNEDIRALWSDPRVRLSEAGREALERLYAEWAAAVRAQVVEAA